LRSKINAGPEEDGTGIANETATAQRTNTVQYHISNPGFITLEAQQVGTKSVKKRSYLIEVCRQSMGLGSCQLLI